MSTQKFEIKGKDVLLNGDKIGFFNDPDNHFQATRGNAEHRAAFLKWYEDQEIEAKEFLEACPTIASDAKKTIFSEGQGPAESPREWGDVKLPNPETQIVQVGPDAFAEFNDDEPAATLPLQPRLRPVPESEPFVQPGLGINAPDYVWWAWHQPDNVFEGIYGLPREEWKAKHGGYLDKVKFQ